MVFVDILVPVFLVVAIGYLFEKRTVIDFAPISKVALEVFTPALVFAGLLKRPLPLTLAVDFSLFMVVYTAILLGVAWGFARLLRFDSESRRALLLSGAMMNIGNFGLPLAFFAFGEAGENYSILIFILFNLSLGTLAVMIAQGGSGGWKKVLGETLKIPIFAAVAAALLLKALSLDVPPFILRPTELLGQAAVPAMLLLLGMQLGRTSFQGNLGFLGLASLIRLVIGPLVAVGLCFLIGIEGLARQVVILQTSTPAAVLPLLYCLRFGTRPDLVAGAILTTTLLSGLSLSIVLSLLQ